MTYPTLREERLLWKNGYRSVAGVDEVGRGCFAGPVVAAAVILPVNFNATKEINDSKLVRPKKRKELARIIEEQALSYSVAEISVPVIDKLGIRDATQRAFQLAVKTLSQIPDFILIDAFYIDDLDRTHQKPIIHGDSISVSIAAASIIAKVYRDELMEGLHSRHPEYDFFSNKGYGTRRHREVIGSYGLCDLHRKSFNLTKYSRGI